MLKLFLFALCAFCANAATIQSRSIGPRIIGGVPARDAQFPFAAAIYHQTNGGTYFCSGTLINNQWILTAGQCVAGAVLFTIRLGSVSLTSSDPNAIRLSTDTYALHPDFDPLSLENDVGLIKLRMPVTFTDYIRSIATLSTVPLPTGTIVMTLGWGQINDQQAGTVDKLQCVSLNAISNEECRLVFGSQITDNMVCVAGNYNEGTCRGDLGSALLQFVRTSRLPYQAGISSFISTNGCESPDPSGFTRIAPYVPWINNITLTI